MMNRIKMKWMAGIAMLFALAVLVFGSAPAAEAAKKVSVESVEYEGKGKVDVEFKRDVSWKKAKVKVKDSEGKTVKVTILDKDEDDISFRLKKYKAGAKYTFTITGVRPAGTKTAQKVSGSFKIPAKSKIAVKEADYDREDREVEIEFKGRVAWKSPKVTITAPDGTDMALRIKEKDSDSIEIKVKKLTAGTEYQYKITGITRKGSTKKVTVKGNFIA